jgi:phosphatidylethanolamine N-methyltransferase
MVIRFANMLKVMKNVASKNAKILSLMQGSTLRNSKKSPEMLSASLTKSMKRPQMRVVPAYFTDFNSTLAGPRISAAKNNLETCHSEGCLFVIFSTLLTFQQCSRECDLSSLDTTKHRVSIVPSPTTGKLSFRLGEPIIIKWQAPVEHSRKDWIGLYRVGPVSNKLQTSWFCKCNNRILSSVWTKNYYKLHYNPS